MRSLLWLGPLLLASMAAVPAGDWQEISGGLELARFELPATPAGAAGEIVVLRGDPSRWELRLHSVSETEQAGIRSIQKWCEDFGLVAAVNAGMFATDFRTHIGYMRNDVHLNSSFVNHYLSVAAFGPQREGLPPFFIYDLDEVPFAEVSDNYRCLVQNLRLIKRPGQNRWSRQDKKWSEVALGQDGEGRILFIFCRAARSMHDLNAALLALPIGLVCAQHLEGGPEAQLYLQCGGVELSLVGSYETGFKENDSNHFAFGVPNVLGLVPVQSPDE